uniref:putative RING-H2 finger protein ATL71 n=1 Tax=Erigeron canadensis TaxID=72917 RepID=UPI001CB90978|nr:putative RING-H2 finger protein ATL71 [Erigeron canadensis]
MSNHTSNHNTRRPMQRPNNSHARYGNSHTFNMDIIPPPSSPFLPTSNESFAFDPWLWSLQDTILSLPPSIMSFRRPRMQLLVFHNNLAEDPNLRLRPMDQPRRQDSELTPDEQRRVFNQLKKEIYNPIPKKIIQRLGKFYKQGESKGPKNDKQVLEDDDDDDKKCVICLEDFEVKEVVMVTPCNHMFHEQCILPWVKSHGKCPVCRFSFRERLI